MYAECREGENREILSLTFVHILDYLFKDICTETALEEGDGTSFWVKGQIWFLTSMKYREDIHLPKYSMVIRSFPSPWRKCAYIPE